MSKDFEQLYTEYYTPVYRYILSLTKDSHTAQDITQETFFKALKNIEKYNPDQKMLTWLCTIAKNTCYSEFRKRRLTLEISCELPDSEDDMLDKIIDSESSMQIYTLLHKLPEPYKEVFTLRILGSLSFKKIGSIFGKTESWARVTFFRSKAMIKESIDNE